MKFRTAALALALSFAISGVATAQVISYSPRTGDIWVDTQLGYMNDYGRNHRDYFVDDIVSNYGAPRYLVNELLGNPQWTPGDVYYACALAYEMRRPCGDVARMYDQDRGQGWGAIAKRMGIKPGSPAFHALKGKVGKSNGKFRSYSPTLRIDGPDGHDRHDNDGPGNSGKAGKGNDKPGKGNGKAGKGNDKGKDKAKGRN